MEIKFVSCVWKDAWADATDTVGERDHDPKHKATIMETMGWLLQDDKEGVSLFNERCLDKGEEVYRSRTFVPRELILSVSPVKLTKPRAPKLRPAPAEKQPTTSNSVESPS